MPSIHNGIGTTFRSAAFGGGGAAPNPDFVSTWDTRNAGSASDTIVLPYVNSGTYEGTIDWGDGSTSVNSYANLSHTYSTEGIYTITVNGAIGGFSFLTTPTDRAKIIELSNCGFLNIVGIRAFRFCTNLTWTATDSPIFNTTTIDRMFQGCTSLGDCNFNSWDMPNVTSANRFIADCPLANPEVNDWSAPSLTNVSNFADTAPTWNKSFNGWEFGTITNVDDMLLRANGYRQAMGNIDISNVTIGFNNFMLVATGLSTANYGTTLIGWAAQLPITYSGVINMGGSKYDSGDAAVVAARNAIIASVGGITDGGAA